MLFSTNFRTESIFLKYLCQFLTEWSEVAVAAFDGHFHQSQVAVKFLVVLNGKVLISLKPALCLSNAMSSMQEVNQIFIPLYDFLLAYYGVILYDSTIVKPSMINS